MDLPDKGLIKHTHRPLQVPVLNLNDTQLPCPQDVRNKVVIWIPGEPEKLVSPADKKYIIPSQDEKKRKTSTVKDEPPLVLSGKQSTETQLTPPGIRVPPSSPAPWFEQLSSEVIPFWNQFDMLPKDLLKDLLSDAGKTMPYPEMKTQLATLKKKPPLAESRPDSAISAHMFLSVHRLTLQARAREPWSKRPALRHPEHLRKLYCNLKTEGLRKKQQKQRKVKTPTKKQEAKKKSRSDPGSQSTKCLDAMVYDPCYGHRTLPVWESDRKEQQEMKRKGPTLKQDSTETPQVDYTEDFLDSFPGPQLSKPEPTSKDIITQMEVMWEAEERTPKDLSASSSRTSWSRERKLLRILEATDFEDEESQFSGTHSTESLEA